MNCKVQTEILCYLWQMILERKAFSEKFLETFFCCQILFRLPWTVHAILKISWWFILSTTESEATRDFTWLLNIKSYQLGWVTVSFHSSPTLSWHKCRHQDILRETIYRGLLISMIFFFSGCFSRCPECHVLRIRIPEGPEIRFPIPPQFLYAESKGLL